MKPTPHERAALNTWLAEMNPQNINSWYMTDDSGKELNFLSAMRFAITLAEERCSFFYHFRLGQLTTLA